MSSICQIGSVRVSRGDVLSPLTVIAGPCLLESLELGLEVGRRVRDMCVQLGLSYIFKASFDKANRSSVDSPRGPGLERGVEWLGEIRRKLNVPVTTDIHEPNQAEGVARVVDLLQIPAFLCRQTDLILAAGEAAVKHGCAVNVKKGQFMSPQEMAGPVFKLGQTGCRNVMLTDRGTFFGYGRLVTDVLGICEMMELRVKGPKGEEWGGVPVCLDCTHSTQMPGKGEGGKVTGGNGHLAPVLARAGVAAGIDALFIETHPNPAKAMSDAATQIPLEQMEKVLRDVAAIRKTMAEIAK